jgi:integrase
VRGNISRRGKRSWRVKFDVGGVGGKRETRYVTVHGKRQVAERELAKLIGAAHDGTLVEPSKLTVVEYLRSWLGGPHGLAGKTAERYQQLAEQQIIPHLGTLALQKLRPAHVAEWHSKLLASGGKDSRALSPRTVGHAHRVLHRALERALKSELVSRNVAHAIRPPKVEEAEVETLKADQIGAVLEALHGHPLHPIGVLALGTGARRGEILSLRWCDVDMTAGTLRIERSLEQTKAGLKFKAPKTKHGRRTVTLPPIAVEALQAHRRRQLELRLALGQGRPDAETLVFGTIDGDPIAPNNLSRDWRRFVRARKLPAVSFHALRHSHASALIASGVDLLTVSRRIGHGSPVVTLRIYGHLFEKTDTPAANAIEAALRTGKER